MVLVIDDYNDEMIRDKNFSIISAGCVINVQYLLPLPRRAVA